MSKFCTTCGATLDDSATFCTNCGTPQQPSAAPAGGAVAGGSTPAANAAAGVKNAFANVKENIKPKEIIDSMTLDNIKNITKNPNKNTIIGLSVCGGVFIILLVIILVLIFGSPYKKALNKYFDAMEDCNGKKYISATMCDFMKDAAEDDLDDYDSLEESYDDYLEEIRDANEEEYGENIKISYKVNEKEELDEDDIESYTSKLENYTDDKETEIKLTEGYKIKTTFKVKGSEVDSGNDEEKATYIVGKVNGKWVILDMR